MLFALAFSKLRDLSFVFLGGYVKTTWDNCMTQTLHGGPHWQGVLRVLE